VKKVSLYIYLCVCVCVCVCARVCVRVRVRVSKRKLYSWEVVCKWPLLNLLWHTKNGETEMITFVMMSAGKHRTYDGHVGCALSVLPFQNWKLLYDSCIARYL
jgi:hypothetical protein